MYRLIVFERGDEILRYLFFLVQKLRLLLQDLLIKVRVKQEAATLPLHQGRAEVSATLPEVILRDPQLEERNTPDR